MGPPKQASKIFKALWAGSRQAVVVMERRRQNVSNFPFGKIGCTAANCDNYFKSVFK